MLETFEQAHAAARCKPAADPIAQRVHVKQREREQQAIGSGDAPGVEQGPRVHGKIAARQDRTLGSSCGAGGVDQRGGRVLGQFGKRRRRCWRRELGQFMGRDEPLRFRVRQNVRHLAIAIQHVDRYEDRAQLAAGEA